MPPPIRALKTLKDNTKQSGKVVPIRSTFGANCAQQRRGVNQKLAEILAETWKGIRERQEKGTTPDLPCCYIDPLELYRAARQKEADPTRRKVRHKTMGWRGVARFTPTSYENLGGTFVYCDFSSSAVDIHGRPLTGAFRVDCLEFVGGKI